MVQFLCNYPGLSFIGGAFEKFGLIEKMKMWCKDVFGQKYSLANTN